MQLCSESNNAFTSRKSAALDDGPSGKVEVLDRVDVAAAVGCMPGHEQRVPPPWITADVTATLLDIMVCAATIP